MSDFLAALDQRVLIFDGAFGTWVQGQDLDRRRLRRPRARGLQRAPRAHPARPHRRRCTPRSSRSASTRSRPPPSAPSRSSSTSTTSPTRPTQINVDARPASPSEVAAEFATPERPALRHRLDRSGHEAPVARARSRSTSCATTTSRRSTACSRAASTSCSSRPSRTSSRRRPRSSAPAARWPRPVARSRSWCRSRWRPPGACSSAPRSAPRSPRSRRLRPDVIGLNCATGPAEMTEHLRYLAQHSRTFLSCLPNAGLPSVVDGHTHYDLTPDAARRGARALRRPSSGINIVGGCCGTTPEHLRRGRRDASASARADRRARPSTSRRASSIYSTCRSTRRLAYLVVGERTNANGSRKFRDAMLEADWDTLRADGARAGEGRRARPRRVRRLRRPRRRRRHGRDREPLRHAGVAAARVRLDRAAGASRPASSTPAARRSSTRPTSRTARARASASTACSRSRASTARPSICLTIDEEGQARTADWKLRIAKRIYDLARRAVRHRARPT